MRPDKAETVPKELSAVAHLSHVLAFGTRSGVFQSTLRNARPTDQSFMSHDCSKSSNLIGLPVFRTC